FRHHSFRPQLVARLEPACGWAEEGIAQRALQSLNQGPTKPQDRSSADSEFGGSSLLEFEKQKHTRGNKDVLRSRSDDPCRLGMPVFDPRKIESRASLPF